MKRVLSWILSFAIVLAFAISVHAITAAVPEISISNAEVTLYDNAKTVSIALNTPACSGIEGGWRVTAVENANIKLKAIQTSFTPEKLNVSTGEVMWTDTTFSNTQSGTNLLVATYEIPAGTPNGTYTVTFTCSVFIGGDWEPVDMNEVYTATIVVTNHECSDSNTDSDHKCDDVNCGKDGVTDHSHNAYGMDSGNHWSVCVCGEIIANTTVAHDFTNGNCVCGKEAPATTVLGDLNLDGLVNSDDLTALARHVAGIEKVTGDALANADVTGDEQVNSDDLTKLARYVGNIIDTLE